MLKLYIFVWSIVNHNILPCISQKKEIFSSHLYFRYLDKAISLNLYPGVEEVEKEEGSNFSMICTTGHMRYYSRKFNWFKDNGVLPNTTAVTRYSTFLRFDFKNLKLEDTGVCKWNNTDDENIQEKILHLTVFGKWF